VPIAGFTMTPRQHKLRPPRIVQQSKIDLATISYESNDPEYLAKAATWSARDGTVKKRVNRRLSPLPLSASAR
jgi:hypothetical protein